MRGLIKRQPWVCMNVAHFVPLDTSPFVIMG